MDRIKRKRIISDKFISFFNSAYFSITEPVKLTIARGKHEHLYRNSEEEPLVSVYVPTYNRGKILMERAVKSVLEQTYKNIELIVVGDHCTDDTEKLLSRVDDPRLRFYNLPNRDKRYPDDVELHWLVGPVAPSNKALELVRGKWIARIDDDDSWAPDHVESSLRFAQKGNYEFVSAAYIAERNGVRKKIGIEGEPSGIGGTQTWLYRSYLKLFKYNINCWRKSWNRVNDADLQDRIFKAGVRTGFLDKVVAYVLPRPGEETIGLDAYQTDKENKLSHFRFS